ncbi:hypothetical protein NST74_29545 [Paenibacillus sp. FSL F4-0125]|uniref:hypothetical protein n=1 Tax=Paenibacillus sp. FSL F4-0125 TaxID=2954730 RepID=UPI0030F6DE5F
MINELESIKEYITDLNFTNRPIHITYKYRVIFQVSRLVLILGMASTKSGSSILKIQIVSDALENETLFDYLNWLINNDGYKFVKNWRYNPLLSRVVSYSNAERLTEYSKTGKLVLTEKGVALFEELSIDESLLAYEKSQLSKIKKRLSDAKLLSILEKGSI